MNGISYYICIVFLKLLGDGIWQTYPPVSWVRKTE